MRKTLLVLLAVLLLASCAKPVPPDKAAFVGEWRASSMLLLITQDGSIAYKRLKGGATTSINGPLKDFEGNNFVVGVGPLKTTFVVTAPPHQENGQWKMTVDGVELTRTQSW
ncbi:MAG TPA: hypothetical protein VK660_02760 [Xanthomonadaceae bacterium]|jgi:hypothetical protein|nr:hypothetical protein [Xanthomonadaceae bacterium]